MKSPILTRSPCLNKRRYAILYPDTMFQMRKVEPREKTTPINRVITLKACEPEPGMYGYATTSANATTATRTRRYVERAHVASKPENVMAPASMPEKKRRISFNAYHVTTISTP